MIFHVFQDGSIPRDTLRLLEWLLVGFGRDGAGYRDATVMTTFAGGFDWEKHLAEIQAKTAGKPDADEPTLGNDAVKVSAVRTVLSRHLFGNADCIVTLTQPFDERWDGQLQPEMEKAIRTYIANLKLTDKGSLLFRIRYRKGDRDGATRFHQTTAKELAETLGFERQITKSRRVR